MDGRYVHTTCVFWLVDHIDSSSVVRLIRSVVTTIRISQIISVISREELKVCALSDRILKWEDDVL